MECRVCKEKIKGAKLPSFNKYLEPFFSYSFRKNNSQGYHCKNCGSISFFQNDLVSYKDGSYRKRSKIKTPPIDLPWSTITYRRHEHIAKLIKCYKKSFNKNDSFIDFGGYNGLCAHGICQEFGIKFENSYIADMDPYGLAMATSMGFSAIDLSRNSLINYFHTKKRKFALITAIHVLEHLENPESFFQQIRNLVNLKTLIYIEVPSKYYFPLSDSAHLVTFSEIGMLKIAERNGFKLIDSKNVSTPREAINYGYTLSSKRESKAYIFKLNKKVIQTRKTKKTEKVNFYSVSFVLRASFSNVFLRLIILCNYLDLFFKLGLKIFKSLILTVLSFFVFPLYIIKFFTERMK